LAAARAIENQSYVILANRVGTDDGVRFCGTSAVIDPSGVVVASSSTEDEELICAEITETAVQSVRQSMPVFAHRRENFYRQTQAGG
jgi:predicted amidohydrolase